MSGRLAIAEKFETPQVPTAAPPTLLKGVGDASSVFAQLVQQITKESTFEAPAATVHPAPPRARTQPTAAIQPQPAPSKAEEDSDSPAAPVTAPAAAPLPPVPVQLPSFMANDEATTRLPRQPAAKMTTESAPPTEAPIQQKEEPEAMTTSGSTHRQPKSAAPVKAAENATAPPTVAVAVPVPVPAPIKLALPSFIGHDDQETAEPPQTAAPVKREQTVELGPAAALELKIRAQDQDKVGHAADSAVDSAQAALPAPQARAAEQMTHTLASLPVHSISEPAAPTPAQTNAVITAPAPQTTVTNMNYGARPQQPANPTTHLEEPLPDQPKQPAQPLRSLSIEFTPDGAQDVRLRLAERAGDVHISLHSTDSALTGRLTAGVHDLVGTLTGAGYDAQAWTPGQGRQNQRQPEDPRRNRRGNAAEPGAEEFGAILQQPIKEVS